MTQRDEQTAASETPMRDHIERFWRHLETEHVRICLDLRRQIDNGVVYWDGATFSNDVAKALVATRLAASPSSGAVREALERIARYPFEDPKSSDAIIIPELAKSAIDALVPADGMREALQALSECRDFISDIAGGAAVDERAIENAKEIRASALTSLEIIETALAQTEGGKPRPLRKTYQPKAPYEVEREDWDDGSIAFHVTDMRPESYRSLCTTNDDGNPYAKHDAEQIARGLNMLVQYGMEQLPNVRDPDFGEDEEDAHD